MKTHEEHVRRVKAKHGDKVAVVGRYINLRAKVKYRCCKHGTFLMLPRPVERGSGCSLCSRERATKKNTKTHEEHVRRVLRVHGDRLVVVGRYVHSFVKIEYRCVKHGPVFSTPSNVELGHGCSACGRDKTRLSHEGHVAKVLEVHGKTLRVVGQYVDSHTKIDYECPEHGIFSAQPNNVTSNESGCKKCYTDSLRGVTRVGYIANPTRKTHAAYVTEAERFNVRPLEPYVTALTKILHECSKGHVWPTTPNQILSGYGCPLCDRSQYRRRCIQVGDRNVLVQGHEGAAVSILLGEGVRAGDLAFTLSEGRPTFRYKLNRRQHTYVPDVFVRSVNMVIEVKSHITLGLYDDAIFKRVCAKARSVVKAGYAFRLMLVHRKRDIKLDRDWFLKPQSAALRAFKEKTKEIHQTYLHSQREHDPATGRFQGKEQQ